MANAEKGKSFVTNWVFDLDKTLYPADNLYFQHLRDAWIGFVQDRYGISEAEAQISIADFSGETVSQTVHLPGGPAEQAAWQAYGMPRLPFDLLQTCSQTNALLKQLPGEKYVFTNGSSFVVEKVLQCLGMADLFGAVSHLDGREEAAKPHKNAYNTMLMEFGITPSSAVFVEDSLHNLSPAHQLGMTTVLVDKEASAMPFVDHVYPDLISFLQDAVAGKIVQQKVAA